MAPPAPPARTKGAGLARCADPFPSSFHHRMSVLSSIVPPETSGYLSSALMVYASCVLNHVLISVISFRALPCARLWWVFVWPSQLKVTPPEPIAIQQKLATRVISQAIARTIRSRFALLHAGTFDPSTLKVSAGRAGTVHATWGCIASTWVSTSRIDVM